MELVQPPIQATKDATKSLANKGLETTTGLANRGLEMAQNTLMPVMIPVAQQAQTTLTPVALKAKEYLPESVRSLVDEVQDQVRGKSFNEVYNLFLNTTRKNLLSIKVKLDAPAPTLKHLMGEVKDATMSGALLNNTLDLSEKAAGKAFGKMEIPKDSGPLRRIYGLSAKVTGGVMEYANGQYNTAKQAAMNMLRQRMDQTRQRVTNGADMMNQQLSPIMTRIGATPLVPSFIFRLLRGEYSLGQSWFRGSSTSDMAEGTTAGKTTVKVDVITQPTGAAKSTTSYLEATNPKSSSTYLEATKTGPIGNTNAQGLGAMGEAGRGVTTTGAEDKIAEHKESTVPPTDDHHAKKKHHHKSG